MGTLARGARGVKGRISCIAGCVVLGWAVEVVNLLLDHGLCRYGILPRSRWGLLGIPLSPVLHGSIGHIVLNTVPFAVLGGLVILRSKRDFTEVTTSVILLGGLGVWLVGRPSYHVGASGLIFGYFGFLVARGWYERTVGSLLIASATFVLYGGILWGVLPTVPYVSWEAHLCGLLAGVLSARKRTR